MVKMALDRLKQLAAHEVGHTLGLAHNFTASVNDRASVMDYPHPYVRLDDEGNIDLSDAYDHKIGAWDKVAITYGYSDVSGENDKERLNDILDEAFASGQTFIADQDARPAGSAHSLAHLWDNGKSAYLELNRIMRIRRKILDRFSERAIREGTPMSSIEEVLVPMYLFHRYQVDAASKIIGGLEYSYALRGDEQLVMSLVSEEDQLAALEALLNTVTVSNLKLPETLIGKIPPRAFGHPRSRETFSSKTGPAFDYLSAIETASGIPFFFLFNPERANRLIAHHARYPETQPGFKKILDRIISTTWKNTYTNRLDRTVQRIVEMEMLRQLMSLAVNNKAYEEVRALCFAGIREIQSIAKGRFDLTNNDDGQYYQYVAIQIDYFLKKPTAYKIESAIKAPDGSPIGGCDF